nr:transposase [Laspinema sp. D3c]
MHPKQRIEEILQSLRPAFSREAAFEWFVIMVWGILLCNRSAAITSYLNAVGLSEYYYDHALHWFHATSWSAKTVSQRWHQWLSGHNYVKRLRGQLVYLGDGIKVSKEGRKMPLVKKLHQESDNTTKREWIRGHYFGAISLLFESGQALLAVPFVFQIQDGLEKTDENSSSLVDKMSSLCLEYIQSGSYVILDAFFASKNLIKEFRFHSLHLITRVKINTVARLPLPPSPPKKGPGRRAIWGERLSLQTLFHDSDSLTTESLSLYGKKQRISYRTVDLHWDSPDELVRFVLVLFPGKKPLILLSTDCQLTGAEIITAYSWRFKIEVTFRTLIEILSGFSYRFWMKDMPRSSRNPKNLNLKDYSEQQVLKILEKVEAFERFVNLNALVLGILQVLSLEMPHCIFKSFSGWFRTLSSSGHPSEQVVRLTLKQSAPSILVESPSSLLLTKFLHAKESFRQTAIHRRTRQLKAPS